MSAALTCWKPEALGRSRSHSVPCKGPGSSPAYRRYTEDLRSCLGSSIESITTNEWGKHLSMIKQTFGPFTSHENISINNNILSELKSFDIQIEISSMYNICKNHIIIVLTKHSPVSGSQVLERPLH